MSGIDRDGDKSACGNSHAVGKCERPQRKAPHGHWEDDARTLAFRTSDVEGI